MKLFCNNLNTLLPGGENLSGDLCESGPRRFTVEKSFASNFAHLSIFGKKLIKSHWLLEIP